MRAVGRGLLCVQKRVILHGGEWHKLLSCVRSAPPLTQAVSWHFAKDVIMSIVRPHGSSTKIFRELRKTRCIFCGFGVKLVVRKTGNKVEKVCPKCGRKFQRS